jgi:hypothetical protein
MNLRRNFDIKRFAALLKKSMFETYRSAIVVSAAVFAVMLIIYIIAAIVGRNSGIESGFSLMATRGSYALHDSLYSILLFAGGLIVTSLTFSEAHSKTRNHEWLMLPASNLEKMTGRLVLTSVGYAIASLAFYFVFSLIAAGVSAIFLGVNFTIFNPFNRDILLMIAHYMVAHSLFFLGAAYFRKYHFIKTALSLSGLSISFSILLAILVRLIFWEYFNGFMPSEKLITLIDSVDNWNIVVAGLDLEKTARIFEVSGKVLYWAMFAPICWILAYFRLKETEVKDGV